MSSEENKSNSEKIINKEINLKEESFIKEQQNKKSLISSKPIKKQKSKIEKIKISKIDSTQPKFFSFPPNLSVNENNKFNFFQSKRINPFEKKDIFDKPCCSCTKTKCIKKYCECFANNRYCKDCHCLDCKNKYIYLNNSNNNLKDSSENEKIFCTCTKSNCNKKYCECYKSRKKCNEECRCINCLNNTSPTFTIHSGSSSNIDNNNNNNNINLNENNNLNNLNNNNKINMNLDEEKSNERKSLSSNDSSDTYKIQRVSIFIDQYQTLVNVEKFTKEDMMLISKKRYSNK